MIQEEKSRMPAAFAAGLVVVLVLLLGLFFLAQRSRHNVPVAETRLSMTAVEQAYAGRIHFVDLKMSRAANFLNQEVTYLFGTMSNDGDRAIGEAEITIEFHDSLNQVVLRETHRVLGARAGPLGAGQNREFQVSFDHVPPDWNVQVPSIRVTGLRLE